MPESPCLDPLHHCKMVLCLPCGDGALLQSLRELGVAAVGLDPDAAAVQRCRDAGLHAYAGDWRLLAGHRHSCDGAVVDLAWLGDAPATAGLAAVAEALLPGGRLLLLTAPATDLQLPADLQVVRAVGHQREVRKLRPPAPLAHGSLGPRVGPYADLFVGCQRVGVLGAGTGRFLDALRLRDIDCFGVEPSPTLAAAARAAGRDVRQGGVEAIAAAAPRLDGIHLGHAAAQLPTEALRRVLGACHAALGPHGRLVVRVPRDALARIEPVCRGHGWLRVHTGQVPHDAEDGFLLALRDAAPAPGLAAASVPGSGWPSGPDPLDAPPASLFDLERWERREWSQGGEDGVLQELFARVGTTNRHYVEFGCGDGVQCNTTALRRRGWQGLLLDGVSAPGAPDAVIHAAWITRDNIEALFDRHEVPAEPDLMSIDLDGNDYWVWQAIARRPRVLVVEYNANLAADRALSIPYDPAHRWDGSDFYGASLLALVRLGRTKGYTLAYCTQAGVNAVFVRDDLLAGQPPVDPQLLYRPPNYWYRGARSVPDLSRTMVVVP